VIFYFNRETGQRVKKSTWKRSVSQGGKKYVRRSVRGRGEGHKEKPPAGGSPIPPPPKTPPKTFDEWQSSYDQMTSGGYGEEFEVESGIDY
jgi:hypothetical protein